MPSPTGSPLASLQVFPAGDELRVVYEYEDGHRFEARYKAWAIVGREQCGAIDTGPPFRFDPGSGEFRPAWVRAEERCARLRAGFCVECGVDASRPGREDCEGCAALDRRDRPPRIGGYRG